MTLAIAAPAKLNLFLHVVGRRTNGYHLLQSAFVLLDFGDSITLTPRADGAIRRVAGPDGVAEEEDLAVRAARRLRAETSCPLGVDIGIDKRIPMGGGLGGGSSDAAAVLLGLNRLWSLGLSNAALRRIALPLGADVPFFVHGRNSWVEGVGEELTPIDIPRWWYVVLTPAAQVPTPYVFKHPELTRDSIPLKIADFSTAWLAELRNDLQSVVLKAFPAVASSFEALQAVSQKSIFGARMTGSGACVFAAFETGDEARDAFSRLPPEYPGFVARGLDKHPFSD